MKAMILSAGLGTRLMPLTLNTPKPMLPIANKPALEHIVNLCKRHNIRDIKMNLYYLPEKVDHYFRDGHNFGVNISYSIEKTLWGTAGAIKRVESFFDETFVVLMGDGLTNIDLTDMLEYHRKNKSKATIAVKFVEDPSSYGVVVVDDKNHIVSFQEKPKKEEAKSNLVNLGIYIIEPEVLAMVPRNTPYDFGKELFPLMVEKNEPFFAYSTDSLWDDIGGIHDFWNVNISAVSGKMPEYFQHTKELQQAVSAHPSSNIAKSTIEKAKGPILIGKNCIIKDNVTLIGPIIIGDDVVIEKDAMISNSIIMNNTGVGKNIEVNDSIVQETYLFNTKDDYGLYVDDAKVLFPVANTTFEEKMNKFLIRWTDKVIAFFALLFLFIPFLFVAILIKLDSKGPIFYRSKRLLTPPIDKTGKKWYIYFKEKSVTYYVFRTMYADADTRVHDLKNKYESGPFKKIEDDPRVTKIGKFLRKASIDELPLFWNILKGDMSLVGIWALPVYEAEYLLNDGLRIPGSLNQQVKDAEIDISELARMRFQGKLGLAGFWQARGRSNLTAEERAIHDSVQAVMTNLSFQKNDYYGEYAKFSTYGGYLKMIFETFYSVIRRHGSM